MKIHLIVETDAHDTVLPGTSYKDEEKAKRIVKAFEEQHRQTLQLRDEVERHLQDWLPATYGKEWWLKRKESIGGQMVEARRFLTEKLGRDLDDMEVAIIRCTGIRDWSIWDLELEE